MPPKSVICSICTNEVLKAQTLARAALPNNWVKRLHSCAAVSILVQDDEP